MYKYNFLLLFRAPGFGIDKMNNNMYKLMQAPFMNGQVARHFFNRNVILSFFFIFSVLLLYLKNCLLVLN